MTASPAPTRPVAPPPLPTGRWLKAGAAVAASRLRPALGGSTTARRRAAVCGAARLLTGLGARVEVRAPSVAWPRTGRGPGLLVVTDSRSPLDALVLLTALPGVVATAGPHGRVAGIRCPTVAPTVPAVAAALGGGTSVVLQPAEPPGAGGTPGRFSPTLFAAAVAAAAPVCPVALRYRAADGAVTEGPGGPSLRAALRWLAEARGVVVEVHLLPALRAGRATPGELATLAEYAVAAGHDAVRAGVRSR